MYAPSQQHPKSINGGNARDAVTGTHNAMATSILNAIRNNELRVHYQPRYDTADGKVIIMEALVRWQKPDAGLVHPEGFLAIALDHGLIFAIDLWVFEQCCKDLIWLREHVDRKLRIAVNITANECESLYHTNQLIKICQSYGLQLADFEFEITENVNTQNCKKIAAFCKMFTELGATVSLDDFGTGYSPLSNLGELNINAIKIDKSFIKNMETSNRFNILVTHMIRIACDMNLKIVAEGIETAAQFTRMFEMGCHQLQGYYISHPLPIRRLLPFLATA